MPKLGHCDLWQSFCLFPLDVNALIHIHFVFGIIVHYLVINLQKWYHSTFYSYLYLCIVFPSVCVLSNVIIIHLWMLFKPYLNIFQNSKRTQVYMDLFLNVCCDCKKDLANRGSYPLPLCTVKPKSLKLISSRLQKWGKNCW